MRVTVRAAQLTGLLLFAGGLASCQKVSFRSPALGRSEALTPLPTAAPTTPPPTPSPTPSPVVIMPPPTSAPPPAPLRVGVLRFEQDSWFKVCFWVTQDGVSSDSSFIGCNKGPRLLGSIRTIELPGSQAPAGAKSCSNLGIRAEVYRNTENCVGPTACQDASYAKVASYTRTTAMAAGPGLTPAMHPFVVRVGGDGSALDSRVALTPELRVAEDEWLQNFRNGPVPGVPRTVRVIFEDQTDENFVLGATGGADWRVLGLDFNDIVFDLEMPGEAGAYGFERTSLACSQTAALPVTVPAVMPAPVPITLP